MDCVCVFSFSHSFFFYYYYFGHYNNSFIDGKCCSDKSIRFITYVGNFIKIHLHAYSRSFFFSVQNINCTHFSQTIFKTIFFIYTWGNILYRTFPCDKTCDNNSTEKNVPYIRAIKIMPFCRVISENLFVILIIYRAYKLETYFYFSFVASSSQNFEWRITGVKHKKCHNELYALWIRTTIRSAYRQLKKYFNFKQTFFSRSIFFFVAVVPLIRTSVCHLSLDYVIKTCVYSFTEKICLLYWKKSLVYL